MNGFEIPKHSIFWKPDNSKKTGVSKYTQNFPPLKLPGSHGEPHERLNKDIERKKNGS
jgi:hypothetical protein